MKTKEQVKKHNQNYYQKNSKIIIANRKLRRIDVRDFIIEYKNSRVCSDCNKSFHHSAMDFDHLGNKRFGIAKAVMMGVSLKTLKKEMEKCELVCSNCHRERTYKRLHNSRVE